MAHQPTLVGVLILIVQILSLFNPSLVLLLTTAIATFSPTLL